MNKRNCSEVKGACVGFNLRKEVFMTDVSAKLAEAELLNKILKADVKMLKDRLYFRKIIEDPKTEA